MTNNLHVSEGLNCRMKIFLDGTSDITNFVNKASAMSNDIVLNVVDGDGMCVSARSLLGMMYAQEFKHMWLVSNSDKIHSTFREFEKS